MWKADLGFRETNAPSATNVRRAYLKLSLRAHPDKGGSTAEFQKLAAAYRRAEAEMKVGPPRPQSPPPRPQSPLHWQPRPHSKPQTTGSRPKNSEPTKGPVRPTVQPSVLFSRAMSDDYGAKLKLDHTFARGATTVFAFRSHRQTVHVWRDADGTWIQSVVRDRHQQFADPTCSRTMTFSRPPAGFRRPTCRRIPGCPGCPESRMAAAPTAGARSYLDARRDRAARQKYKFF